MRSLTTTCAVTLIVFAASVSQGTTYRVDTAGGGDFATIQEGINAAGEGDTVLVAPGTYVGPLNTDLDPAGVNISIISEEGAEATIIDCGGLSRGISYESGEGPTSRLMGFTIRNGQQFYGGAVYCVNSSPTIANCVFEDNVASQSGGAMLIVSNSSPTVTNCRFEGNHAMDVSGSGGGAVYCEQFSAPLFTSCVFADNVSDQNGGAVCAFFSSPSFTACMFYGNSAFNLGGAIIAGANAELTVGTCTIADNYAYSGGGIFASQSPIAITNTIIALNDGTAVECADSTPEITHCCIFQNTGGDSLCGNYHDNMFVDPLFCHAVQRDFDVHSDSPCLPEYNPWGEQVGASGAGGCGTGIAVAAARLALGAPVPNPFSSAAVISCSVAPGVSDVEVVVFSAAGRRVRTLAHSAAAAGRLEFVWDGTDDRGERVASGVYFVRATSGTELASGKLILLR